MFIEALFIIPQSGNNPNILQLVDIITKKKKKENGSSVQWDITLQQME